MRFDHCFHIKLTLEEPMWKTKAADWFYFFFACDFCQLKLDYCFHLKLTVAKSRCEKLIHSLGGPDYKYYTENVDVERVFPGQKVNFQLYLKWLDVFISYDDTQDLLYGAPWIWQCEDWSDTEKDLRNEAVNSCVEDCIFSNLILNVVCFNGYCCPSGHVFLSFNGYSYPSSHVFLSFNG